MAEEVKNEAAEQPEENQEKKEESREEQKAEEPVQEKPLDKLTAPKLREIAKGIPGVSGVHSMKKAELLDTVKKFREIKDNAPAKKKATGKTTLNPNDLKLKIARLRDEKDQAREAKERRKVDILRRRINRMKKKIRKAAQA